MWTKRVVWIIAVFILQLPAFSQVKIKPSFWKGTLQRTDGNEIVFTFNVDVSKKPVIFIHNAKERLRVDDVTRKGDSLFINMPFFESAFKIKLVSDKRWEGIWVKGGSAAEQVMPFVAVSDGSKRFEAPEGNAKMKVDGKWAVKFGINGRNPEEAVGLFAQKGNAVTGSFLTPTGDYRFLEGIVSGDSLMLSTFDGSHAYVFTANIQDNRLVNGKFYSGLRGKQEWEGVADANAVLPADTAATRLKIGEEKIDFTFTDLEGKKVSLSDARFKNKAVVIQIMGSWCPNCMDETAFLSDYYNKNKAKNVEIVSLAYEYSADIERSKKGLRKFQQQFNVKYPMLITGVKVSDSLRTEKTLPQITKIKAFPTTIYLDKKGRVKKIDAGFSGPGTGHYYEEYKKEFYATIEELLKEKDSAGPIN